MTKEQTSAKLGSSNQRCAKSGLLSKIKSGSPLSGSPLSGSPFSDYLKFIVFCALLLVPVYAIANSALNGHWIMMMVDALLVPVGFVHGILLIYDELT